MDTLDINIICSSDPVVAKTFKGVCSYDTLPERVTSYPASYICNTDIVTRPGEHWVALFFENNEICEYFDSYGLPPYGKILAFAKRNGANVVYNRRWLQSPLSHTCGLYCVYYLWHVARGMLVQQITGSPFLPGRWEQNDAFVTDWMRLLLR